MRAGPPLLAALVLLGAGCSKSAAGEGPRVGPAETGTESPTTREEVSLDSSPRRSTSADSTADSTADTAPLAPHPEVTDNRVYVVGDSIAESIASRYSGLICDALGPLGWDVVVDAVQGRRTDQAVRSLRTNRERVGQTVLVLIGHNDGIDPESYRQRIDQLISLVPEARRILLLTNYEFERGRDRMNEVLREIAAVDGDGGPDDRLQLVDWNAAVEDVDGAIQRDGIHLTDSGQRALATVMAAALGPAPGSGGLPDEPACTTLRDTIGSGGSGSSGSGGTRRTTTTAAEPVGTEPPSTEGPPATNDPPGTGGPRPTDAPEPKPTDAPPGSGQGQQPPDDGKNDPPGGKDNSPGPTSAPAPPGT
jgi:lysophospholipase L1-like esterase